MTTGTLALPDLFLMHFHRCFNTNPRILFLLVFVWIPHFVYFYKTDRFQSRRLRRIPKIDHYSLVISLTRDSFPLQHCAASRRNALFSPSPVLWSGYADCSLSFFLSFPLSAVTVNSALLARSPKLLYEPADYGRPRAASWVSVTRPSRLTFSMPSKAILDLQVCRLSFSGTNAFCRVTTDSDHTGVIWAYIISWYNIA